jgi:hypothetical protein
VTLNVEGVGCLFFEGIMVALHKFCLGMAVGIRPVLVEARTRYDAMIEKMRPH